MLVIYQQLLHITTHFLWLPWTSASWLLGLGCLAPFEGILGLTSYSHVSRSDLGIFSKIPKYSQIWEYCRGLFENVAPYIKTWGQGWISVYEKIVLPVNVKISNDKIDSICLKMNIKVTIGNHSKHLIRGPINYLTTCMF